MPAKKRNKSGSEMRKVFVVVLISVVLTALLVGKSSYKRVLSSIAPAATPIPSPTPPAIVCNFKDAYQDEPTNTAGNYHLTHGIPPNSILLNNTKLVYHFKVTNSGASVPSVSLIDPLPTNLTFVDADPECKYTAQTGVVCTLGALATGASTNVGFRVKLNPVTTKTRFINKGYASTTGVLVPGSACLSVLYDSPTLPTPTPVLKSSVSCIGKIAYQNDPKNTAGVYYLTTKIPANSSLAKGTTFVYAINLTNGGPGSGDNTTISDPLPANTTFVDASTGCTLASGKVTCNLGTFVSGGATTKSVRVKLTSGTGTFTNTATVNATQNLAPSSCSTSLIAL